MKPQGSVPLALEWLIPEDADAAHSLMVINSLSFKRFFPKTMEQNLRLESTKGYISRKIKENILRSEITYGIKPTSGTLAGLVILKNFDRERNSPEIAYCIGPRSAGKGLATQAVIKFTQDMFGLRGLKTITAHIHATNVPSIRVARKSGFIHTRTLKKSYSPPGEEPIGTNGCGCKKHVIMR